MKRLLSLILVLLFSSTSLANSGLANSNKEQLAKNWLTIVDQGSYTESWKRTAPFFQNHLTSIQWDQALKQVRKPLGKTHSRKLSDQQPYNSLPGAPKGEYVVIKFTTSFEHKANALETVTLKKDDSKWRVAGYFIK